jgi:hypothetical protein
MCRNLLINMVIKKSVICRASYTYNIKLYMTILKFCMFQMLVDDVM